MALMRCIVLLLTVAVATYGHPHKGDENATPEMKACHDVLMPTGGREAIKTMFDACVGEQEGLQATIDGLKKAGGSEKKGRSDKKGGHGGGGGGPRGGKHGGRGGNPVKLLEDAGKTVEVEKLKKCLARMNGHLAADESFDVEKFKTEVAAKATGTDSEANIQLGIDNCPADALTSFDVHKYMHCVVAYCATGEAPSTEAPPADDAEAITP